MNKKCANKLAFRWGLLAFVVSEFLLLGYWKFWQMPTAETLRTSGGNSDLWLMPVTVTRFLDPFVIAFVTFTIFRLCFYRENLLIWYGNKTPMPEYERQRKELRKDIRDSLEVCVAFGIMIGIAGSVVIALSGFVGLVIGTTICSTVILCFGFASLYVEPPKNFITNLIACLIIFGLNTLYQGMIAGAVYALAALAITTTTYFGIMYATKWGKRFFTGTFRRTMLECNVESQNC